MAKIDLNIIDCGKNSSYWTASNTPISAENLDKVLEQKTDNCGALNSLPTPFARFFVAQEAFRRMLTERDNQQKEAGFAYRQMVSDILDVYELLFNLSYHRNNTWQNGEKLEIREWDSEENFDYLKNKMPILYNAVYTYYQTDIKEPKLYFVVYIEKGKEYLLATSSPITGFVTPPDMDKSHIKKEDRDYCLPIGEQYHNIGIPRNSETGGYYFDGKKPFEERGPNFKNYVYNVLFAGDNIDGRLFQIKNYIRNFRKDKNIRNNYQQKLKPVLTDNNDALVINGLPIMQLDEVDVLSYFNPKIIRIPYRISSEHFKPLNYENEVENRTYDYLMPFKPSVYNLFEGKTPDASIHINKGDSVTVTLKYKDKTYKKTYEEKKGKVTPTSGEILNLEKEELNFDVGLFPNILSHIDEENNYFKVMVVNADNAPQTAPHFDINNINLKFYRQQGHALEEVHEVADPDQASFGTLPAVVRSHQQKDDPMQSGTKFYELFNTTFSLIEINICDKQGATGLVEPNWGKSVATGHSFTYAIDLGTSNTFMSRCRNNNGIPDTSCEPEQFTMSKPMVSYLHQVPNNTQFSYNTNLESSIFEKAKSKIKTEFLPALIDGKDSKFPIRTALCGIQANKAKLFDSHNIAFFYQKWLADKDQEIHTDIKWTTNEDKLRLFVQELLLIIKCDILQRNGTLAATHIVWFSPLSFSGNTRTTYERIWNEEPKKILKVNASNVQRYSESEAPYYFYKKKNYIPNTDAVAVIDIGGGSTDFVYFVDNEPKMANSVHFGCDVLWDKNAYVDFRNNRENGIYQQYADNIRFGDKPELTKINKAMIDNHETTTKDIINFWINNDKHCGIVKSLSRDFKPVFVYHLTSILYYLAELCKENALEAPRSIVFSGNGSRYIDNFISADNEVLSKIVNSIFSSVFGEDHKFAVSIKLPEERKEATCYGGLYREQNAPCVQEIVYHGDRSAKYETVADMEKNKESLTCALSDKYKKLGELYATVLNLLRKERILDKQTNTQTYIQKAQNDMMTSFHTHYKDFMKGKNNDESINDSVFFIPIIERVFELTIKN